MKMRRAIGFGWREGRACRGRRLVAVTSALAVGLTYCHAAQRDEERGYPFTAAFEWRKAAELLAAFAPLACRCWQEWERIMCLPRRMATVTLVEESPAETMTEEFPVVAGRSLPAHLT